MFKTTYKSGLLSIFSSCGSNPLQLWQIEVNNGHVRRMTDKEIGSFALEIVGCNVSTTFIRSPKGTKGLGISLPYMVMLVKNMKKPFTFEVTIIDDIGMRRRIRVSTFQSKTQIQPMSASMPIALHPGWNKIQLNLAEYTSRSFHTQFAEVANVKINANIRLRRIYFAESLLSEDELPNEYRLYKPSPTVVKKTEKMENNKENMKHQAIKGSKVKVILEPKIKKEGTTPAEPLSTEGETKVKIEPQAADEQEISSKADTAIGEAALESEAPVTKEDSAIESKVPITEEETVAESQEMPAEVDTATADNEQMPSEPTEPVTTEASDPHTEPSQLGEPVAVTAD